MSVDLIRNRPVFDKEILKPGTAIKFKVNNECHNAIVIKVELDNLTAIYCSYEDDTSEESIHISEVIDNTYEIQLLK